MSDLDTRFEDVLAVFRAAAGLAPLVGAPIPLRDAVAARLSRTDPALAIRVRALDDWHTEALAEWVAEAHLLARAFGRRPAQAEADTETRAD